MRNPRDLKEEASASVSYWLSLHPKVWNATRCSMNQPFSFLSTLSFPRSASGCPGSSLSARE
jgi:hypothetical protein